jgi:cation diffusion facilitator family transporter
VLIGLFVANVAVVIAKLTIGLSLDSLAVLGDSVHASIDAMNNIVALIVIRIATRAPDEDHPYGHTKFETLGALAIVVFLSISGFELVRGAVWRLFSGVEPLNATPLQLAVLLGTLIINTTVATYEARRGRELDSELLLADAAHTKADVAITGGVLLAVILSRFGLPWADPLVALVVAGAIVVIAYGIIARSVPILVDQHVMPADEIRTVVEGIHGIVRAYDIRSRGAPDKLFAELTIAVDRNATVDSAHKLADEVESRLHRDLGFHETIVHIEPC